MACLFCSVLLQDSQLNWVRVGKRRLTAGQAQFLTPSFGSKGNYTSGVNMLRKPYGIFAIHKLGWESSSSSSYHLYMPFSAVARLAIFHEGGGVFCHFITASPTVLTNWDPPLSQAVRGPSLDPSYVQAIQSPAELSNISRLPPSVVLPPALLLTKLTVPLAPTKQHTAQTDRLTAAGSWRYLQSLTIFYKSQLYMSK